MKKLIYITAGVLLGIIISIGSFKYLNEKYKPPYNYHLVAEYFLEVPKDDFERFSIEHFKLQGARSAGYIMGTSDMITIRGNGECGDDIELENFLTNYLNGNQFVCYMIRRIK